MLVTPKQHNFRLPDAEVAALDAYARHLESLTPGLRVSRTAALRSIYLPALRAAGIPLGPSPADPRQVPLPLATPDEAGTSAAQEAP